jgi:hypothetical protein
MCLKDESPPSRWKLFHEVRDTLRQLLAPALPVEHLLRHGKRIAQRLRLRRPKRSLQVTTLARLSRKK